MGTWSHQPFGNDTAADWVYGLEDVEGFSYIEETLDRVLACGDGYLEASESEEAIAAIEVLAKVAGRGTQSDSSTEAVDVWVAATSTKPPPALLLKAQQVIDRIMMDESELLELWQESEELNIWLASLTGLRAAIA